MKKLVNLVNSTSKKVLGTPLLKEKERASILNVEISGEYKIFFMIGIRRSGTSIFRTLLGQHPAIIDIEYEPHPLWNAVDLNHFKRFSDLSYVKSTIDDFVNKGRNDKWYGAKFALNPGTKALEWIWLHKTFPKAKFIFIVRNENDTWKSVYKQDKDSVRGIINKDAYFLLCDELIKDFHNFNGDKCIIKFENLVRDADNELKPVWELLNISPLEGLNETMKKPRNWSEK